MPQQSGRFEDTSKCQEAPGAIIFDSHLHPYLLQVSMSRFWALSHQEGPALPQMQDILLDLRMLFLLGLHYLFHIPLIPGCHWPSVEYSQCWHLVTS